MSNQTRSARGVLVNFDLMKLKEQIATAPKPTIVQARENFVDTRLKRRVRRAVSAVTEDVTQEQTPSPSPETTTELPNDNPTPDPE